MATLELIRRASGLAGFLRQKMTLERARADVRRRFQQREERFLEVARTLIFGNARSPYLPLLRGAGISYPDLAALVGQSGLETALRVLLDQGVFVTLPEYKCKTPIVRGDVSIAPKEKDFDAQSTAGGLVASTSGSRSGGTSVMFDWPLILEHSASELLLLEAHHLADAPALMWLPAPPGIAAIHGVLMRTAMRKPTHRWFAQIAPGGAATQAMGAGSVRMATRILVLAARTVVRPVAMPELLEASDAAVVAREVARMTAAGQPPMVRAYASGAVRVARAALLEGMDIAGTVFLTGGEALTDARRAFVESAGARAFPRYSAADAGLIAASCPHRESTDDMHIYSDRFAVVAQNEGEHGPIFLTTLSPNTGRVLLNVDIGDVASLREMPCACPFGEAGLTSRISLVRSLAKITAEGVSILLRDVEEIVGEVVMNFGGTPVDYQIAETQKDMRTVVRVTLDPSVAVENDVVVRAVRERLMTHARGGGIAGALWEQADTIIVERAVPRMTRAAKLHPIVKV